ncbi:MAG TPA: asparaginase [Clostridiales bacterium UBA8153]|nr:asparaginase [Clostridiales bacterium UBA8153]
MKIIASTNGRTGIFAAMDVLRRGGSAIDAVEAGIRLVEDNPEDHTVGYSGLPNLLGEVELDASIMDGRTRAAGAVGAIKGFPYAISVARRVMEELPHCFLVGEGAARFGREMGCEERELLTPEARDIWRQLLEAKVPEVYAGRMRYLEKIRQYARVTADPERPNETVNFIAMDAAGNLCCGVSTSGWAWKYPGRLGDSPVIGAGNYADNRYGAAACTGRGEMAIRAGTARAMVLYLGMGMTLDEAGPAVMRDLYQLEDEYFGRVSMIAMDAKGGHRAFSLAPDATYLHFGAAMAAPEELPRVYVAGPA